MADANVVRNITIRGRQEGVLETTQAVKGLGDATTRVSIAFDGNTAAALRYQQQIDQLNARMAQLSAANDNVARSAQAANDNAQGFVRGLVSSASSFLETISHLKLLAVAAYALSPALRGLVNTGIATGASALGANFNVVAGALTRVAAVAGPALSFFTRLTIPIGLAVAGFKLFGDMIERGNTLMEKNSLAGQRALFGGGDPAALEKLLRFQGDTTTPQQNIYAAQLSDRLETAKQSISDFFKVQLDLTDPALKLQNAWVVIVESLAKALTLAGQIPSAFKQGANAIGNASIWDRINNALPRFTLPGAIPLDQAEERINEANGGGQAQQLSAEQALEIAKRRLAAGMGGGFNGRFNAMTDTPKDIAKPTADRDAFDKFVDQQNKANAALQASVQTVGLAAEAHERLKIQLQGESILERDGVKDTDARREKLAELAKQAGETAAALARAQVTERSSFERSTLGLTDQDARIAQELKGISGPDIPTALRSAEAEALRLNDNLKTGRDIAGNFASSFALDLSHGVSATVALSNAINKLKDVLIDMIARKLMQQAFGGLLNSFGGSGTGDTTGGMQSFFDAQSAATRNANGNAFSGGNIIPFANGGIVNSPTLFPMANGAGLMGEAGPEAVMPLKRGSDGKLGVAGAGGTNVSTTINLTIQTSSDKHDPADLAEIQRAARSGIEQAIDARIIKHLKPNGLLNA